MNLPTLIDVALGLSLVFFILASIGSVLAELWAAHQKLRHRLLRDTVNRLLGPDIADKFWQHSLILPLYEAPLEEDLAEAESVGEELFDKAKHYAVAALAKSKKLATALPRLLTKGRRAVAPAYLDAQLFATVVLDLASGQGALGTIPNDRASWEATIKANIAEIIGDDNDLEDHLLALLRQIPASTPDTAAALKAAVVKWYEEAMQRASGTYRRQTQKSLLVVGLVLALGLNVDAVRMAQVLYLNPQLRSDVAAQATAVAQDPTPDAAPAPASNAAPAAPSTTAPKETPANNPAGTAAPATASAATPTPSPAATATATNQKTPREQLRESAAQLRDLAKIGFPLGWQSPARDGFLFQNAKTGKLTFASWLAKILGLAASTLAVCLGAPFWFDVMSRLVKLRSSAGADAEKSKTASSANGAASAGGANPPPAADSSSPAGGSGGGNPPAAPSVTPAKPLAAATVALANVGPGFDPARAYWLAEFADHAYETSETLLRTWLTQQGFTFAKSFNNAATDTQAFLATAGNVAVLSFRGTEKKLEDWLTDAQAEQIADPAKVIPGALHKGFTTAFNSVAADIVATLIPLQRAGVKIHVTGHSLGAALASLAALHLEARPETTGAVATVHTFGSPRVGDPVFAAAFERAFRGRSYRFVNNEDIVTRVPPPDLPFGEKILRYEHVGEMKFIDAQGKLMGDVSFMFRLLNFTTNALGDVKDAVATTLKDHSMVLYCANLRNNV